MKRKFNTKLYQILQIFIKFMIKFMILPILSIVLDQIYRTYRLYSLNNI